jgi:integrase
VAMVWILLATGLRPLEVARLQIGDYLDRDGAVRLESEVREGVAVNRRARPLYFTSAAARAAIDAYLQTRPRAGANTLAHDQAYRGLHPDEALFLSQEGRPFKVESIPSAAGTRYLCQEIHYAYRKIFRRIGVPGLTAINVRHTVMDRLGRRGANESQISELLGVRGLRQPKRPRLSLRQLMYALV